MSEYARRYPNGKAVAGRMNLLLSLAGRDLGESMLDRVVQGSYNKGGVSASAGTHDAGGAVDLSTRGWSYDRITQVLTTLRRRGLIAWYRHEGQGFSPHIHGIDRGARDLSAGAAEQVRRFDNGENGLASRVPDDGPRVAVPSFDYAAGLLEWDAGLAPLRPVVASYNAPSRSGVAKLRADVARMADAHDVSLVALQETSDRSPRRIAPAGWSDVRPVAARSASIIYSPAWSLVRHGAVKISTASAPADRFIVWADLTYAPTGDVWQIGSVHLVARKHTSVKRAREFLHQESAVARWLRAGSNRVILGDLNADRGIWTPNLRRDAVWESPRVATKGRARIDHALRPKGQAAPETIAAVPGASDHRALVVRL